MKNIRAALVAFVVLSVITGLIYPLAVTGIAQVLFPSQANGDLIGRNGKPATLAKAVGSRLIGQTFDQPQYFWGRPSATSPMPYNAASSGASNTGPSNPALVANVKARIATLTAADPGNKLPVPVDLVTSSGSGLDPDISVAAALYQAPRVAAARHMSLVGVQSLIKRYTTGRQWGIFGEAHVNVLRINLALDAMKPMGAKSAAPAR